MIKSAEPILTTVLRMFAALLICFAPKLSHAAQLSTPAFEDLASRCAPAVQETLLSGIARTESGLDPWTLHNNTTGISAHPASVQSALSDADIWIGRGDSIDIGLMQINSANLAALGLTPTTALDPCASLSSGAAVLQAAYGGGNTDADQQVALLLALSRYNTGSPLKGIMNGYARTVMVNAAGKLTPPSLTPPAVSAPVDPDAPPAWNISATASYSQLHGAPWLISLGSLGLAQGTPFSGGELALSTPAMTRYP